MVDISPEKIFIQQESVNKYTPTSEFLLGSMGASINYLLAFFPEFSVTEFNLSQTWTKPSHVTKVIVMGCGGGGGGSSYYDRTDGSNFWKRSVGGQGAPLGFYIHDITSLSSVSVSIGAGGAGGTVASKEGKTGQSSIFDTIAFNGGKGGGYYLGLPTSAGNLHPNNPIVGYKDSLLGGCMPGMINDVFLPADHATKQGQSNSSHLGGQGIWLDTNINSCGGGAGPFGAGGRGCRPYSFSSWDNAIAAVANSGGGGGSGSYVSGASGTSGASGGSGKILVFYPSA
jgi:hypothetical protein